MILFLALAANLCTSASVQPIEEVQIVYVVNSNNATQTWSSFTSDLKTDMSNPDGSRQIRYRHDALGEFEHHVKHEWLIDLFE
jgi:hypothetical protein